MNFASIAIFGLLLPILGAGSAWAQNGATVGEASFVIGVARLMSEEGGIKPVGRGSVIRVGDRIETEAGGHVHIRFVDGGQLSVRPESRLKIEDYRHDSQSPARSAIKFRLDEGVVRSVTGTWGEAARDRFRLNTPIAAIGIKGTDFVVKADAGAVYASVNTGAIVLSPLDASCAATLGPCLNGREEMLSAAMRGKMLELTGAAGTPRLVPAIELMPPPDRQSSSAEGRITEKAHALQARSDAQVDPATKITENETRGVLAVSGAAPLAQAPAAGPLPPPVTPPAEPPVVVSPPPVIPPAEPPVVVGPPVVEELVWARQKAAPQAGDTLSKTFAEAREKGRQALLGNLAYTLFRQPTLGTVLNVAETSADFRLAGAVANMHVTYTGRDHPVDVTGGTLHVDFAHSSFNTGLNASSAITGDVTISASGKVKSDGIFVSQAGNANIVGALTLDGKEAGYLFERQLSQGTLSGVTLWGR